jgi:transposase
MPQPYSADLGERVLVACERVDLSQVEIAHCIQVCPTIVANWGRQEREEGRRGCVANLERRREDGYGVASASGCEALELLGK